MRKIPGGYYIKARQIKDSWVAHAAPVVREVWDYLLREANHEDRKYNGFVVKRGQLFRSYRDIRDDLHWMVGARKVRYSENQMKHTMKLLRSNRMIDLVSQPRGNIITVLNYDEFQNPKNYESTSEKASESTSDQPRINQSSTAINKNYKYSDKLTAFVGNFISYIKETKPKQSPKSKNLEQNSLDEIDKLIRLDGFDLEYIRKVIGWAVKDDFWGDQVFSLAGLRKKSKSGLTKFQNISAAYEKEHKEPEQVERVPVFRVVNDD